MSKISFFQPFSGGSHTSHEVMEVTEFLNHIKYGKWQVEIEAIRNETDKEKRSLLKKKLPSVTMSGIFTVRKVENKIAYSVYIFIDIDNYL